ncbi:MAG TPA: ScyD/ScyE family protein [Prolixibacteraceae bacterium]|nr:ScyD/ScyE family protein [Prolixibacteraceae bacterium]
MKKFNLKTGVLLLVSLFLLVSCGKDNELINQSGQDNQLTEKKAIINPVKTTFATGFSFPRGLEFGPDGYLYVALAGMGGADRSTCENVIAPVGPYFGGNTGSIIKISPEGVVTTVASGLPSQVNALGFTSGVADIAFIGSQLYALVSAGCSHGNGDFPSSVVKVNSDGTWTVVADISAYLKSNPVAAPEKEDFEPDGSLYSMVNVRGDLYVIEPNHGEMMKVTTSGEITRVIDFSAYFGHIVPTTVTYEGNFYVGNLRTFPLVEGSSSIYKVTPSGQPKVWATGFTGILGLVFDQQHRMYVLETSQEPPANSPAPIVPGTGRVVLVNSNGTKQVIVDGLNFPTGMTFGPDGALYISDSGFGDPTTGQIIKVKF